MAKSLLVKVCGITSREQLIELNKLPIDMVGFNFFPSSPRFVHCPAEQLLLPKSNHERVGVFVNTGIEELAQHAKEFELDYLQLHGDETPEFCINAIHFGKIIKAFGLHEGFDFNRLEAYKDTVSLFLFDTRSKKYGGSGLKFDWAILDQYKGKTPFLLSGGISLADIDQILLIDHARFTGIDVNSGFEVSPGIKNIELLKNLTHRLQ